MCSDGDPSPMSRVFTSASVARSDRPHLFTMSHESRYSPTLSWQVVMIDSDPSGEAARQRFQAPPGLGSICGHAYQGNRMRVSGLERAELTRQQAAQSKARSNIEVPRTLPRLPASCMLTALGAPDKTLTYIAPTVPDSATVGPWHRPKIAVLMLAYAYAAREHRACVLPLNTSNQAS